MVLVCNVKSMGQLLPQIAIIVVGVAAIALCLTVNRKTVKALKAEVA